MATVPSLENVTAFKGGLGSHVIEVRKASHLPNNYYTMHSSAICSSTCVSGNCSQPGDCDCFKGWTGNLTCDKRK